jgi:hypothetical protein
MERRQKEKQKSLSCGLILRINECAAHSLLSSLFLDIIVPVADEGIGMIP